MLETLDTCAIAAHYLPALINADYSGMDDDDAGLLDTWAAAYPGAWFDYDADEALDFRRCEVCGLMADCVTVRVMREVVP